MSMRATENAATVNSVYSMRDKAFYLVQERILAAYDKIEQKRAAVKTPEELNAYVDGAKKAFRATMGVLPYSPDLPFDARVTKTTAEDGLTVENHIFLSRKGVHITANLYIPKIREERAPAVLLQCGHSLNGKADKNYQAAARMIAARGIVVLVTDPLGQGERQQYTDEDGSAIIAPAVPNHQQFGTQCFLLGENPVKYFLADALRAVDYLSSLPFVDSDRIGATGNSGGGTMTSLLMAYDDRIKAAAPSCWPCAGKEYFLTGGAPDAEQIWLSILKNGIDSFEIMACMCKKPLLLLGAAYDFIPIEGFERLFAETKRLYSIAGAEELISSTVADEQHGFSEPLARAVAEFFAKHLGANSSFDKAVSLKALPDAELYATDSGILTKDIPGELTVQLENLAEYESSRGMLTKEEKRAALEKTVYNARPKEFKHNLRWIKNASSPCADGLFADHYLWFTGEARPCYGVMLRNEENKDKSIPVTICLWMDGTNKLEEHEEKIKEICKSGRAAFVVDLTAMGKSLPYKLRGCADEKEHIGSASDKIAKCLFTLGDSLGAIKAYDLLQSTKMVRSAFSGEVDLYTIGNYSILARIAQALDGTLNCTCDAEVTVRSMIESKYYETYDTSHIIIPAIAKYIN